MIQLSQKSYVQLFLKNKTQVIRIISIKDLKSINGAKFHIITSTAKYIIAIKNKTQVVRKNPWQYLCI